MEGWNYNNTTQQIFTEDLIQFISQVQLSGKKIYPNTDTKQGMVQLTLLEDIAQLISLNLETLLSQRNTMQEFNHTKLIPSPKTRTTLTMPKFRNITFAIQYDGRT